MSGVLLVYVTCPAEEVAADITKTMIEKKLAACGNILPMGRSFFRWDGKIEEAGEATIIFKTTSEAWPALRAAVEQMHPYDVPCIVAVPVTDGHAPFLAWVRDETILP